MRILIATGIYPPTIGGPAQYAVELGEAFKASGHVVRVLTYGKIERFFPFGLRHLYVFLRALFMMPTTDLLIALDTISTGLPATLAAKILRVRCTVRIGGDFLWETFVERTKNPLTLPEFYTHLHLLSVKEKVIFSLQKFLLRIVDDIVFTTDWQRRLWENPYHLTREKCHMIENAYVLTPQSSPRIPLSTPEKCFLWAGRPIVLKNLPLLTQVFEELHTKGVSVRLECVTGVSHVELIKKIGESYAVILPSLSDVSPNVILDGVRAGVPFIMTKHTGISDRLFGAGLFVDPTSKEEILNAVLALCDEGVYRKCQSALNNLSYVHTYEDIAKEFLTL
jgi:glycosyltransferase involved in cell wall biosynthesis